MVLIETYWNVKIASEVTLITFFGINRNILECKDEQLEEIASARVVLIETYWNVKLFASSHEAYGVIVLIETYWNVKSCAVHAITCRKVRY